MFDDLCHTPGTFFVTGTGTDIGKTYISCMLIRAWHRNDLSVCVKKPLLSGVTDTQFSESDTGILLRANKQEVTPSSLYNATPFRFDAPQSPDIAARFEDRIIDKKDIIAASVPDITKDVTLIEGAGGIMAPVCEHYTSAEWIRDTGAQAILVGGCYLGGLSHMLTALTTAHYYHIPVKACIINEYHTYPNETPTHDFLTSLSAYTDNISLYVVEHFKRNLT